MGENKKIVLDVREMSPWERHPKIFEVFDSLPTGDTLILVNDHDPRPLHYQFLHERERQFEWRSYEKGSREWVAEIKKVGTGSN